MSRGWATIYLKSGRTESYNLEEKPDGFYFMGQRVAALRNYMLAERKAQKLFRQRVEEVKRSGKFKDAYSSMWYEHHETHTTTYKKKPSKITGIRRYGTHPYNLGFEVQQNFEYVNGQWQFDRIYYTIDWYPTEPVAIQITKSSYTKGSKEGIKTSLSKKVLVTDKKDVKKMIQKFRSLHSRLKKKFKKKK